MNLSQLIEAHKGRRSYTELERDCGGSPSAKRLQQLATLPIRNFPDPPTVVALARGLRVPQRVIVLAAAESLELDVFDRAPRLVQLLPTRAAELSEEQAAALAHLVDAIVNDPLRVHGEDAASSGLVGYEREAMEVLASQGRHPDQLRKLQAVAGAQTSDEPTDDIDAIAAEQREKQGK